MTLGFFGHGGSGKSFGAAYLASISRLRYWGSTSRVIAPHAAKALGISEAEAFRRRHEDRPLWRRLGDDLRRHDPAALARETLRRGDICEGVRARVEIEAIRREGLCDLMVWVACDVPPDGTLEFGPEMCDLIIENDKTAEFEVRLRRLANALGILRIC